MAQAQLGGTSGAGFGWDDMTVYKAGAQWEATPNWTWRAGYSKSESPIPESEVLFNILAPGVIDDHVTAGFSRALRGNSSFNFALMYAIENSVKGANPMEVPGQQTIELTMDEWEAEMSWSMRF
jgi:long-chain fatty acid transport protein